MNPYQPGTLTVKFIVTFDIPVASFGTAMALQGKSGHEMMREFPDNITDIYQLSYDFTVPYKDAACDFSRGTLSD